MSDESDTRLKLALDLLRPVGAVAIPETDAGEGLQDPTIISVITGLKSIFQDSPLYRQLLQCEPSIAQKVLDYFQRLLDTPGLDLSFRNNLIVAMQRLSFESGLYPTVYRLEDSVEYDRHDSISAAQGGYSYICSGHLHGQVVCLKVVRISPNHYNKDDAIKRASKEVLLWGQLSHPNILPVYGVVVLNAQFGIVSPWMENGNVKQHLDRNPHTSRQRLVADVAIGLKYLHDKSIIHGDIKGSNVLVDLSGRALLGLSQISSISDSNIVGWPTQSTGASRGGTVRWQAPELFDIEGEELVKNTAQTDVYAWGCLCFEIFSGRIPFSDLKSDIFVMRSVLSGRRPARPESTLSLGLTDDMWSLMERCWSMEPNQRPSSTEIVTCMPPSLMEDNRLGPTGMLSSAEFRRKMSDHITIIDNNTFSRILHNTVNSADEQDEVISQEPAESEPLEAQPPSLETVNEESSFPYEAARSKLPSVDQEPIAKLPHPIQKLDIVTQINSKDVVIAIMGTLGMERECSFIEDALGNKARGFRSSPFAHFYVTPHPRASDRNIFLVHTADLQEQTFSESLRNIFIWLFHSCCNEMKLSSLIYLTESLPEAIVELSSHSLLLNKCVEASNSVIAITGSEHGHALSGLLDNEREAPEEQQHNSVNHDFKVVRFSSQTIAPSNSQHASESPDTPWDIVDFILMSIDQLARPRTSEAAGDPFLDDPRDTDIVIPIVGAVGAGKSTFINFVTGQALRKGDQDALPKTTHLHPIILPHPNDPLRRIVLIDTPGFDDSHLTYSEIWRRLAIWLAHSYFNNRNLGGFIYLCDINQTLLLDAAQKHLDKFSKLVGRDGSKHVVLATTKWSHAVESISLHREEQLQKHEWKGIIDLGATYFRFTDSHESGQALLRHIILQADAQRLASTDTRVQTTGIGVVSHALQNLNIDFRELFLQLWWRLLVSLSIWTAHLENRQDQIDIIEGLVGKLALQFEDADKCKLLLSCRNAEAQALLDTFQLILNIGTSDPWLRRNLIIGIRKLSTRTNLYPSLFYLSKLDHVNEWPEAGGGYGDIYKGVYQGRDVCVKLIKVYQTSKPEQTVKMIAREAVLWGQLSHPNLLPFYGLYLHKDQLALISPWAGNGTLSEFLKKSTANRLLLCSDIAEGIGYLHDNDMIHGDLKGINILIDTSYRAYLADFGLSAVDDNDLLAWSRNITAMTGGTLRWQAPELFPDIDDEEEVSSTGIPNTKATDVYAFAFVCYEIFTGSTPFAKLPDFHVMLRVKAGHRPDLPTSEKGELNDELRALIKDCWHGDPAMRPDIVQVRSRLAPLLPEDRRLVGEWRDGLVTLQWRKTVTEVPLTMAMLDEILRRPLPLLPDERDDGLVNSTD